MTDRTGTRGRGQRLNEKTDTDWEITNITGLEEGRSPLSGTEPSLRNVNLETEKN